MRGCRWSRILLVVARYCVMLGRHMYNYYLGRLLVSDDRNASSKSTPATMANDLSGINSPKICSIANSLSPLLMHVHVYHVYHVHHVWHRSGEILPRNQYYRCRHFFYFTHHHHHPFLSLSLFSSYMSQIPNPSLVEPPASHE